MSSNASVLFDNMPGLQPLPHDILSEDHDDECAVAKWGPPSAERIESFIDQVLRHEAILDSREVLDMDGLPDLIYADWQGGSELSPKQILEFMKLVAESRAAGIIRGTVSQEQDSEGGDGNRDVCSEELLDKIDRVFCPIEPRPRLLDGEQRVLDLFDWKHDKLMLAWEPVREKLPLFSECPETEVPIFAPPIVSDSSVNEIITQWRRFLACVSVRYRMRLANEPPVIRVFPGLVLFVDHGMRHAGTEGRAASTLQDLVGYADAVWEMCGPGTTCVMAVLQPAAHSGPLAVMLTRGAPDARRQAYVFATDFDALGYGFFSRLRDLLQEQRPRSYQVWINCRCRDQSWSLAQSIGQVCWWIDESLKHGPDAAINMWKDL